MQNFLINNPVFKTEFFSNSLLLWIVALGIFILSLIILKIIKTFIVSRLHIISKKTKTNIDDIIIGAITSIRWPFYFILSLFIALQVLHVQDKIYKFFYYILLIAIAYYIIRVVVEFIDYATEFILAKDKEKSEDNGQIVKLLSSIAKIAVWAGALMMLLSNLGYDVTSLIAGLGIGGIAVALALQNILSDIFSSFSIYFDKPFKIGDFIMVGSDAGTIKKIGIKSTRLQSLQGEEIVISNRELTQARIQNFGLMDRRRVVNTIGVVYNTPAEKLRKIPEIIKEIVEKEKLATFDRTHFKTFNNSSLDFEIVYYIDTSDYNVYMDTQESINLKILDAFESEKIEFAFPSQTVYLNKN